MLDPEALDRHLKVCYSHFGEADLYKDDGSKVEGFFTTRTIGEEENRVPENTRHLSSPERLPLQTRITDRKKGTAWLVKFVEGDQGAFIHTLEATAAA